MIFFPFAIPAPAGADFAITTVHFEKNGITSSTSTTSLKTKEDGDFNSLEELIEIKNGGLTTTTVSIRERVEDSVTQQISDFNYYTEDYEINSPVTIRRTVKVKAKVKSVKKMSPKAFID